MNMKEIEAALVSLTARFDEGVEHRANVEARLKDAVVAVTHTVEGMQKVLEGLKDVPSTIIDYGNVLTAMNEAMNDMKSKLDDLTAKVEGRNKSAPVKRNMTDDDAVRVLQGDLADQDHKQAAEVAGLTYAQVYSCRLGFTFKHVHRDLEKGGFKNKWAKG